MPAAVSQALELTNEEGERELTYTELLAMSGIFSPLAHLLPLTTV